MNKVFFTAPVMALLMCGTAQAALTADQVWADLQAAAATAGLKIVAATQVSGDGELTLNGVTFTPEGEPAIATISELSLVEQEDGSVAFFPADIKLENTGPAKIVIGHEELSVSAFEDEGGLGYGIDADSLNIKINVADGDKIFDGTFDLISVGGRYTRGAETLGLELSADQIVYDLKQKDPELGIDSAQISDTAEMVLTGEMALPQGINLMSMQSSAAFADAVRAGLGLSFELTQGVSKGELVDNNPMMPLSFVFVGQPGTTSVVLNGDSIDLSSTVDGMEFTARPPMVPAPVSATTGTFGLGFSMPVVSGDEGGSYGLELTIANLVLDDAAWGMIDMAGALDHGPLDLSLDLGGSAKIDMLDLMVAGESGTPPNSVPEVQSLDIRALAIKALGAALTGKGAFTFDNSMVALGGPPLPVGTADLRLEGGNKVIDSLIKMGILTDEDAMGARMMMAMFGKPEGDDILTSQIEAREGGSIFVNGQQIQ